MLESSLIIADRDVDQAQATVLAIRNAGFDHPIFYFRSSAALIARLSAPSQKAPKPSTLLIDVHLLRECGPELLRHTGREAPLEIVALLSGERERALAEECGFGKIPCLLRPVKSMDVLRLLGVQATRPKPVAHPRLLWPGRPEHIGRPPGTPVSQFSQQTS